MNERARTILILADGDWPADEQVRILRSAADLAIAADGGWARARCADIPIDIVIGDFDSLPPDQWPSKGSPSVEFVAYPPEKDWTDLELALDHALSMPTKRVIVVGGTGSRIDHTLAAVFLLEKGAAHGVPIELIGAQETIRLLLPGVASFPAMLGDRLSLLPLSEAAVVRTGGLRYPLHGERIARATSRGVSNEAISSPITVEVESGRLLVVHAPAEPRTRRRRVANA